jgi:hypothetical protein
MIEKERRWDYLEIEYQENIGRKSQMTWQIILKKKGCGCSDCEKKAAGAVTTSTPGVINSKVVNPRKEDEEDE